MSDERDTGQRDEGETLLSVEHVANLDIYLDRLVSDRSETKEVHSSLSSEAELSDHLLAAQFQLLRDAAEQPRPAFLRELERRVGQAIERDADAAKREATVSTDRQRVGYSRSRFLRAAARTAATLAGGAGLGVGATEAVARVQDGQRPHELVVAGNDRWYPIATSGEVPSGGIKAFTAGGVMGFLLNVDGRLHAVSGLCTHMGCRLKPDTSTQPDVELRCLCHNSRFNNAGEVIHGLAPTSLPRIMVREENGQIFALGTRETV